MTRRRRGSRLWRIPLAVAGLGLAWIAVLLAGQWAWSSSVLAGERARVDRELRRVRFERIERPIFFAPAEEGNAWDLIAQAAAAAKDEWEHPVWSALFLDSRGRRKPMPEAERDRIIDSITPQFERVKQALRRRWTEPDHWTDSRLAAGSSFIGENRLLGVLEGAVLHRYEQARYREVTELLVICLGLADRLKVKGSFWSDVNADQGDRAAHRAIRRLLSEPAYPREELKSLAKAVEDLAAAGTPDLREILRRRSVEDGFYCLSLADDTPGVREFVRQYRDSALPGVRDAWSWRSQSARLIQLCQADREQVERVALLPIAEWILRVTPLKYEVADPEVCRYWHLIQRAQGLLAAEMSRIGLAVSLFAETHCRWPADLSEVNPSLPLDPWTGRPFQLEIRNAAAVIAAPELEAGVCKALSTSLFKAEEWRKLTVVRRAR